MKTNARLDAEILRHLTEDITIASTLIMYAGREIPPRYRPRLRRAYRLLSYALMRLNDLQSSPRVIERDQRNTTSKLAGAEPGTIPIYATRENENATVGGPGNAAEKSAEH